MIIKRNVTFEFQWGFKMTAADKYWWIYNHASFVNKDLVYPKIEIEPHNVCPDTNRIEDHEYLNTKVQYWVELMTPEFDEDSQNWILSHDYQLDCGGDTFEEAIDALYNKVLERYGTYKQEDADALFDSLFKKSSHPNPAYQQFSNPHERLYSAKFLLLNYDDKFSLIDSIDTRKNTIKSLQKYIASCTIEQSEKAKIALEDEECLLWLQELSLKTGVDLLL